jgi:hypothetical protein
MTASKTTGEKTRIREREGTTNVMGESEKTRNRLRPIKVQLGANGLRRPGSNADKKKNPKGIDRQQLTTKRL